MLLLLDTSTPIALNTKWKCLNTECTIICLKTSNQESPTQCYRCDLFEKLVRHMIQNGHCDSHDNISTERCPTPCSSRTCLLGDRRKAITDGFALESAHTPDSFLTFYRIDEESTVLVRNIHDL